MKDILVGALVVAAVGALLFILSANPDVDSIGWALFIIGIIVAAIVAVILALRSRRTL